MTRGGGSQSLSIGPVNFLANARLSFLAKRNGFLRFGTLAALELFRCGAQWSSRHRLFGRNAVKFAFEPALKVEQVRGALDEVAVDDQTMDFSKSEIKQFGSPNDVLIRVSEGEEEQGVARGSMAALRYLQAFPVTMQEADWIRGQEKVGPKIGELSGAAVRAVLVAAGLILVSMAWRFHRFLYGIFAAAGSPFHDVLAHNWSISLLGVEISTAWWRVC